MFSPVAPSNRNLDLVRPYLWLALVAFSIGFLLSLSLAAGRMASDRPALRGPVEMILPTATPDAPSEGLARLT
ncbi:MAG TPA: hypothetical protein VFW47_14915 [Phenylobacterium sp.]|nr:hypothetical protein [Phenylobacterium sp.]